MWFINKIFINFINFYRKFVSPLFPPCCRFYPTCSEYSLQAYRKYNFLKATKLSVFRILRCNPWHKGGYDPLR